MRGLFIVVSAHHVDFYSRLSLLFEKRSIVAFCNIVDARASRGRDG